MLQGLLVDLVPFGKRFQDLEHQWENSIAAFWGDMGNRQFYSKAAMERQLAEWVGPDARDPKDHATFGILTKTDVPIGLFVLGFDGRYHLRSASLGAMIGEPDYWGGGYGTDALLLACDYAFNWLDLRRLYLTTMALNDRVVRQMARVGFTLEQTKRDGTWVDGQWIDTLKFGLLRDEWPGRDAILDQQGFRNRWGVVSHD